MGSVAARHRRIWHTQHLLYAGIVGVAGSTPYNRYIRIGRCRLCCSTSRPSTVRPEWPATTWHACRQCLHENTRPFAPLKAAGGICGLWKPGLETRRAANPATATFSFGKGRLFCSTSGLSAERPATAWHVRARNCRHCLHGDPRPFYQVDSPMQCDCSWIRATQLRGSRSARVRVSATCSASSFCVATFPGILLLHARHVMLALRLLGIQVWRLLPSAICPSLRSKHGTEDVEINEQPWH